MSSECMFVGYQFRVVGGSNAPYTLADNINPLYIPNRESLRTEFESIMEACVVPFIITTQFSFLRLLELYRQDSHREDDLLVLRCAILKSDSLSVYVEYYDISGNLVSTSLKHIYELIEPQIDFKNLGYDVLDATVGGGFDSAIHTYNLCSVDLNERGLLESTDAAVELRNYAGDELTGHGPFSVWSIGLVEIKELAND